VRGTGVSRTRFRSRARQIKGEAAQQIDQLEDRVGNF
jgi:hypothetical protein